MTTYEPGVIADATVRGVPNVRVMRVRRANPHWVSVTPIADVWWHYDDNDVTDVRPLIVLDLYGMSPKVVLDDMRAGLPLRDSYAWPKIVADIEAQTKPPKPVEPTGLGAVVEDRSGVEYVHLGSGLWAYGTTDGPSHSYDWDHIDAVRVLSEGVIA